MTFDDNTSLFSTFAMALYIMVTPVCTYMFLKMNFKELVTPKYQNRFGSLYLNLKPTEFSAVFQVILFFIRRLIYALSICFFGSFPLLQAVIQVLSSMLLIIYTLQYKPYLKKTIFYFELMNEMTLLTSSYFLIVFCDILMDYELRFSVGWYITLITLLNVLVNYLNLIVSLIRKLIKRIRKHFRERKLK